MPTTVSEHAARELAEAGISGPVADSVAALAGQFDSLGLEGQAPALVADLFWKLANMRNLTPLDDGPGDWADDGDGVLRHRRCPDLSRRPGGPAVYSRALVFRDGSGQAWSGGCWADRGRTARVESAQEVLAFPFMPRTFALEVARLVVGENSLDDFLADPGQLDAARAVYRIP